MSARTPSATSQQAGTTPTTPTNTAGMSTAEHTSESLNPEELETLFLQTLRDSNRFARSKDLTSREVVMAKMVNYCIRMLHSHDWVPRTVVRTMVHMEAGTEGRTIKSLMFEAMRERRNEARAKRAAQQSEDVGAGVHSGDGEVVESKTAIVEHKDEIAVKKEVVAATPGDNDVAKDKNVKVEDTKE